MLDELKNIKSTKGEIKKFGNSVGGLLIIISILLFIYSKGSAIYFLSAGSLLVILGNLFPAVLKPLQIFWMGIAVVLGWFSTRIILGFLFYFVITPIKFTAKIFGKEFLDLKIDKDRKSYWNYREKVKFTPENYERQF